VVAVSRLHLREEPSPKGNSPLAPKLHMPVVAPVTRSASARTNETPMPPDDRRAPAPTTNNPTSEVAAPEPVQDAGPRVLRPGFPQSGIPNKATHQDFVKNIAARRKHDEETSRQLAMEARARESEGLAHVVSPVTVSYNIKDLQRSNRLLDGFKLDLSPGSRAPTIDKHEIARMAAELIRKELQDARRTSQATNNGVPVASNPPAPHASAPIPTSPVSGSDDSPPPRAVRVMSGVSTEIPDEVLGPWVAAKGIPLHKAPAPKSESPSREVPMGKAARPRSPHRGRAGEGTYGLTGVGKATVMSAVMAAVASIPGAEASPVPITTAMSFGLPDDGGILASSALVLFALWFVFVAAFTICPKGVVPKCIHAFVATATFVLATLMLTDPQHSFAEVWGRARHEGHAHWLVVGGVVTVTMVVGLWRRMASYLFERSQQL
jgi:hypothetical protein